MFRLACGVATMAVLGLIPMATAAMFVALIGVGLGSLALYQLNRKADETFESVQENRRMIAAGAADHRDE